MRATRYVKAAAAAAGAARAADRRFTWSERFTAIPGMLGATITGRFPGATRSAVGLSLLGIVYVISPLDLIPELFLGPFGLADDAGILALSVGYLVTASDRYLHWRNGTTQQEGSTSTKTRFDSDVVEGTVVSD
jgi:uncharacterized membrane protein YkvA (DUF1232 family)